MAARHVPERTCVACRSTQAKRELVRLVRTMDQQVQVDPTGKRAGRGAYLCARTECWRLALRRGALDRALKTTMTATDRLALEEYARMLPEGEGGLSESKTI